MAEKGFKSKPTTIRSAEVVSYSRLMVSDDMATFRTLIEYRGMITTYLIGNIDNLVSSLRMVTSKMFGVPLRSVTIYMVCDHFFSYYTGRFGDTGGTPHYLKVLVDGKNITEQIIKEEFFSNVTTIAKRTPVVNYLRSVTA